MILESRRNLDPPSRSCFYFPFYFSVRLLPLSPPSPPPPFRLVRRSRSILSSSQRDCRARKHRRWLAGEFTSHGAFVLAPPRIKEILSLLRPPRRYYVAINEFVMRRSSRPGSFEKSHRPDLRAESVAAVAAGAQRSETPNKRTYFDNGTNFCYKRMKIDIRRFLRSPISNPMSKSQLIITKF